MLPLLLPLFEGSTTILGNGVKECGNKSELLPYLSQILPQFHHMLKFIDFFNMFLGYVKTVNI